MAEALGHLEQGGEVPAGAEEGRVEPSDLRGGSGASDPPRTAGPETDRGRKRNRRPSACFKHTTGWLHTFATASAPFPNINY